MIELLPAPNSASRRSETAADSELASSQPPADSADEVWLASVRLRAATTMESTTIGRRKR